MTASLRRWGCVNAAVISAACTLALDPDDLRFAEVGGEDVEESDAGEVTAPATSDAASDVPPDAPRSIGLTGGASKCTGAYKLVESVVPLAPTCAAACAPGAESWSLTLEARGPGAADAAWTVEATKGYAVSPASGKGAALEVALTLPDENCSTDDAVPAFTLLVTARYGGETVTANIPIATTLDKGCPAIACE